MAQMPAYRSRYGDTIADLLARRGDIAAMGAMRSGDIWGQTIGNIGAIAGGAVQDYAQHQEQKKAEQAVKARDMAIAQVLSSDVANNPAALGRELMKYTDPKTALSLAQGVSALQTIKTTKDKNAALTQLPQVARAFQAMPEALKPGAWTYTRSVLLESGIATPEDMPEQYSPEAAQGPLQFALGLEKPEKPSEPKVIQGALVSPEGKVIYQAPAEPPKPEKPLTEAIGGRIKQWNPETKKFDIDLGASEAALGREAALGKEERTRADKEEAAKQAANETRTQVSAAFAAMENRLKDVEKYAGSKAITSPLEAAFARQQYLAAANAFAATLSRATGDTRISDRDRAAYAKLLTYAGKGSGLLMTTRPDLTRKLLEDAKQTFEAASNVGLVGGTQGLVGSTSQTDPMGIRQ